MKKSIILILSVIGLAACDSGKANPSSEDSVLTASPTAIEAAATAGEYSIAVTCSRAEWTAYATDACSSWVSTSVNTSESTVTVSVSANGTTSDRSGAVVVKSGTYRAEVSITQAAPLQVSTTSYSLDSYAQDLEVSVTGSSWSASASESWLSTSINGSTLTIAVAANETLEGRSGVVTVSSVGESVEISIYQESGEDLNPVAPEGYTLVWHDEFNEGSTLGSDWTHEVWSKGYVNNELQYYVNGGIGGARVTELVDGKLNIHCFKSTDGNVYSARVYAKVTEGWTYGYFEARILLPSGKGTWPAWWMMPVAYNSSTNAWPYCGEIDIMEEVGCDPNYCVSTIHCQSYNHTIGTQKTQSTKVATAESEYHVYAVEWTEDYLKFYIDGSAHFTFNNDGKGDRNTWPFDYAFYPILNLAWGGDWGGYKGVDEDALPVTMKVDYVRIYQK